VLLYSIIIIIIIDSDQPSLELSVLGPMVKGPDRKRNTKRLVGLLNRLMNGIIQILKDKQT
jgi:hypothetical protein